MPNKKKLSAPHLFANLYVGTIQSTNRQRAVHRKLHVARTRGLKARRRYLLGQVRGRINWLRVGDVVVGIEDDFNLILHI